MLKGTKEQNSAADTKKGRFITFEGGEGVGKSTQVKLLIKRLQQVGVSTIRTREPGGTPKAEAIRKFILTGKSEQWGAEAEAILFAAARLNHVNELIAPNLKYGCWVICDRFHDSTRAYQGLTGGVDELFIGALEKLALNNHQPDLTILLDMDPKIAFERVAKREKEFGLKEKSDRFEKENLLWHQNLRKNFLKIAKNNPHRISVFSADMEQEKLAKAIWDEIRQKFPHETLGISTL